MNIVTVRAKPQMIKNNKLCNLLVGQYFDITRLALLPVFILSKGNHVLSSQQSEEKVLTIPLFK